MKETYDKIKGGLDFYLTGTKILGNDIGYALTLVSKAVQVRRSLSVRPPVSGTQDTFPAWLPCLVPVYYALR